MQEKAQNSAESERRRLWGWQAAVSQGPGEDRCVSSQMRNRGMWTKGVSTGCRKYSLVYSHMLCLCLHLSGSREYSAEKGHSLGSRAVHSCEGKRQGRIGSPAQVRKL